MFLFICVGYGLLTDASPAVWTGLLGFVAFIVLLEFVLPLFFHREATYLAKLDAAARNDAEALTMVDIAKRRSAAVQCASSRSRS